MGTGETASAVLKRRGWYTGVVLVSFFVLLSTLPAQPIGWGVALQGGVVQLRGSFEQLPNFPYRPGVFQNAGGWYGAALAQMRYPANAAFAVSLAAGYQYQQSQWTKLQQTVGIVFGNPQTVVIEHQLDGEHHRLIGELAVEWSPVPWFSITAGGFAVYPLRSVFRQQEVIRQPAGATFVGSGTATQQLATGNVAVETPWWGLAAGLQFRFNLTPPLQLVSGVSGVMGLQPWWKAGDVREQQVGGSVALHWHFPSPKPVYRDTVFRRDTVVRVTAAVQQPRLRLDTTRVTVTRVETSDAIRERTEIFERYVRLQPDIRPFLAASIRTAFVLQNGIETEKAQLRIEELLSYNYVPLLRYLFFDLGQDTLPARYRRLSPSAAEHFAIRSTFFDTPLAVYYHVLNIVGLRLRRSPSARLTITGCNAGAIERNDQSLSQRRAAFVRRYLQSVWHIEPSRLQVQSRGLPANPSPLSQPQSIEENARVELAATDPEVFAPVTLVDTLRIVDPPTIRFRPRVVSEAGVARWRLRVWQQDRTLFQQEGTTSPPSVLDWEMNPQAGMLLANQPVSYQFEVVDSAGQRFQTPVAQFVFVQQHHQRRQRRQIGDRVIERYTLILFDFDKAELRPEHKRYLDWIRQQIPEGASVTVIGTTDTLGNEQYNRELSRRRAQAVAEYLRLPNVRIIGRGEAIGEYRYPEQRFYHRTVHIVVESRRPRR